MKNTFKASSFNADTFASGEFQGLGTDVVVAGPVVHLNSTTWKNNEIGSRVQRNMLANSVTQRHVELSSEAGAIG